MRSILRCLMALCAMATLGCDESPVSPVLPVSPSEAMELMRAEATWAAKGFESYAIEVRIACGECPRYGNQSVRVEVVGGVFNGAVLVATGEDISEDYTGYRTPVESLFARIREANSDPNLRDLVVEYDETFGHPSSVAFHHDPSLQDASSGVLLRNLEPLVR
ncbi:MAG: DUF6174 domain-containing protein [Gemmatimonadales bacterium]